MLNSESQVIENQGNKEIHTFGKHLSLVTFFFAFSINQNNKLNFYGS